MTTKLRESVTLSEGGVNSDGTITLDLIRPCVGRGKGTHLYEAEMLARDAGVFTGWKMYVDHLSDSARRQLGGLPRSMRDLGGRIVESWWNPNVPADPSKGLGPGAVQGRAIPTPFIRELVENDPEIALLSINGNATAVRPVTRDGKRALLVEGIEPDGSVDWVTEAGAGGRVVSLTEAAYASEEARDQAVLVSMSDDELREYLAAERPDLALAEAGDGDGGGDGGGADGGSGEGTPSGDGGDGSEGTPPDGGTNGEGDDDVPITPEALREALSTDEGKAVLAEVFGESAGDLLAPLVEAAVADEREVINAQAEARANRAIELRDLRDHAVSLIEAANLPEQFSEQSKSRFALTEDGPSASLDVIPEVDDDGNVTKSAREVLTEAVNDEIKTQRDLVGSVTKTPTRVRGQGASGNTGEGEGGTGDQADRTGELTRSLLQESGFNDPDKVYDLTEA